MSPPPLSQNSREQPSTTCVRDTRVWGLLEFLYVSLFLSPSPLRSLLPPTSPISPLSPRCVHVCHVSPGMTTLGVSPCIIPHLRQVSCYSPMWIPCWLAHQLPGMPRLSFSSLLTWLHVGSRDPNRSDAYTAGTSLSESPSQPQPLSL